MEMSPQANDANPSINKEPIQSQNDNILARKDQSNEMEKRMIKIEVLMDWLRRKQQEEEVLIEAFGKDVFQEAEDSLLLQNNQKETEEKSGRPLTYLGNRDKTDIREHKSSIIARDCCAKSVGNHAVVGKTNGFTHSHSMSLNQWLLFQHHHSVSETNTKINPPLVSKNQTATPVINPSKDISGTKRSIEMATEEQGDEMTSAKKVKPNQWNCEVCNVETNSEYQLKRHLSGKKHLAMIKASEQSNPSVQDE